jgi:hypothetical protein
MCSKKENVCQIYSANQQSVSLDLFDGWIPIDMNGDLILSPPFYSIDYTTFIANAFTIDLRCLHDALWKIRCQLLPSGERFWPSVAPLFFRRSRTKAETESTRSIKVVCSSSF